MKLSTFLCTTLYFCACSKVSSLLPVTATGHYKYLDVTQLKPDDETSLESCCVFDKMNAHGVSTYKLVCHNFVCVFFPVIL